MNDFNSQHNDTVLNVGINNGDIHLPKKESDNKNDTKIEIKDIKDSTVTTTVNQLSNHQPLVALAMVVIAGIVIFAISNRPTENSNSNTPVITVIQPTVAPINTNVEVSNSNPNIQQTANTSISTFIKAKEAIPKNNVRKDVVSTKATPKESNKKTSETSSRSENGFPPCAYTSDPSDDC